jgi:putative alpha-1,2-mannosidase
MKVGLSYVSVANAALNLKQEISHWSVEKARADARAAWDKVLGQIEVNGGTDAQRRTFYSDLYHSLMHPSTFSDVNGEWSCSAAIFGPKWTGSGMSILLSSCSRKNLIENVRAN